MSALAWKAAPLVLAIVLAGGAYFYVFHSGVTSERNANAGRVLVESEDARKLREVNDAKARAADDARALECLRSATGCR